jgi:hypothetical protein
MGRVRKVAKRELWRTLKVGDRVRLVEYPPEFRPGYQIHPDTVSVYKKLIARGRSMRVYWLDHCGAPWIRCRFRRRNGQWEHHYLCLCHDGISRVKPRVRTP